MLKNETLRRDADAIVRASLNAVLPDEAVRRALKNFRPQGGRVLLVAAGKAAWQMAHAAVAVLGNVDGGVVVTKYGHVKGTIPGVDCCEAGHPVPDENGFAATRKALELVQGLTAEDTVLFLLSGGGSALFEKPLIPGAELQQITGQLLASGADIVEMNTIRKRLSGVKGGRFAQSCAPAQVFSIVLSDRQRPGGAGYLHLCTGPCHCGKISPAAFGTGQGSAGTGDSKGAGPCCHADHRQRAGAVQRSSQRLPGAGL